MRHRIAGRKLGRDTEHRLAMQRNLVSSLFEHERVSTTIEKAKEARRFAEKLITLAKKGDLASRRRAISLLGNRDITAVEDGDSVKKGTVVGKLFSDIAPRYLDRPGGYTRIVKLAMNRLGDNGQVVLLQLVGEEQAEKSTKKTANKRGRRAKAFSEITEAVKAASGKKTKKDKGAAVDAGEEKAEDKPAEVSQQQAEEAESPEKEESKE